MTPPSPHALRSARRRAGALLLALGATSVLGCSALFGPSETRYVLETISNVPLPAPFDSFRDTDGNIRTLEAVESRLTLFSNGTFRQDMASLRKLNGEVVESLQVSFKGRVERVGQTLIIRWDSIGGYEERIDYEVLEGGRRLEGPYFGRVYRWVRE